MHTRTVTFVCPSGHLSVRFNTKTVGLSLMKFDMLHHYRPPQIHILQFHTLGKNTVDIGT